MQSFDAVEQDIEGSREYTSTPCVSPALHGVGFTRIGDSIGEQETVLSLKDVADKRKGCLGEKIGLGRLVWENMGERVYGRRRYG